MMRRIIMMVAARQHDDRRRQHDNRRVRQALQIILADPAGGACIVDLAPAAGAALDIDGGTRRHRDDDRIIGGRTLAQIDVGGGDRRRGERDGGQCSGDSTDGEGEAGTQRDHQA